MFAVVPTLIGIFLAVIYVGFFALKIGSLPLWAIVIVCLGLMLYACWQDAREELAARNRNGLS